MFEIFTCSLFNISKNSLELVHVSTGDGPRNVLLVGDACNFLSYILAREASCAENDKIILSHDNHAYCVNGRERNVTCENVGIDKCVNQWRRVGNKGESPFLWGSKSQMSERLKNGKPDTGD